MARRTKMAKTDESKDVAAALKYFSSTFKGAPAEIPSVPFEEACEYLMPYGKYKNTPLGEMVTDDSQRRYLEMQLKWDDIRPTTAGNIASVLKGYRVARKVYMEKNLKRKELEDAVTEPEESPEEILSKSQSK